MCCLKIDTETLLANCLNTCKTYSFSQNPRQGSPLRERWEELAHEFLRKMNVYNL